MADEAELQASEQEATVENTADSATEEQSQAAENSNEQVSQETDQKASAEENKQENKKSEDQDTKPDSKPLSRRSAAYRIKQLVNDNNALREKLDKQEPDEWEDPQEESQPNIEDLVAREVERRLNPVISENSKSADDAEINELFTGERTADRALYEPKIREMWNQAQYKDVAASDLYKIAKFDEAVGSIDSIKQQAVEEYKAAEKQAKESSSGGNSNTSNRAGATGKSLADMSDQELLDHNERIKAGLA